MPLGMRMETGTHRLAERTRAVAAAVALILFAAFPGTVSAAPGTRTLVFFGDSLTAGYGLADPDTQSYPALIQGKIDDAHLDWHVVNAGLSGETSAGGLRRIDWVLRQKVDLFVLELGANDGLRGTPTEATRANLQDIISRVRAKFPHAPIVLAGMRMPGSMGPDYAEPFRALFPALAAKNDLILIPFLLEGVAGRPDLNQGDAIHPNATGAAIVAATVWHTIVPFLMDDR